MGGGGISSSCLSQEKEYSSDQIWQNPDELSSENNDNRRDDFDVNKVLRLKFDESDAVKEMGRLDFSSYSDSEILKWRRRRDYEEIMRSYDAISTRIGCLEETKHLILSYKPGAWIDKVGCMEMSDYDVPRTITLLLIGPRGSGKSSLVNRISRIFENEKFTLERAQVSYNSSFGDGTYYLQEYMVPRGSTSICLYDTRSLSESSSENLEMIERWMVNGVCHGEVVIRDSDSSVRKSMECKAQQTGYRSCEKRMVNYVIFVINGLSILKSMEGEDDAQYMCSLAEIFRCPYLSFKDDKPVVVITHGDFLSQSDRARVRIHLGELLGIPPATQIFDIPDKCDVETELTVLDMLRYSLMHAERHLPRKTSSLEKDLGRLINIWERSQILGVRLILILVIVLLAFGKVSYSTSEKHIPWYAFQHLCCSSRNPLNWFAEQYCGCLSEANWNKIRHLWLG